MMQNRNTFYSPPHFERPEVKAPHRNPINSMGMIDIPPSRVIGQNSETLGRSPRAQKIQNYKNSAKSPINSMKTSSKDKEMFDIPPAEIIEHSTMNRNQSKNKVKSANIAPRENYSLRNATKSDVKPILSSRSTKKVIKTQAAKPNVDVECKLKYTSDRGRIVLNNVDTPEVLSISSPTLSLTPAKTSVPGEHVYAFNKNDSRHDVLVTNAGKDTFKFSISPVPKSAVKTPMNSSPKSKKSSKPTLKSAGKSIASPSLKSAPKSVSKTVSNPKQENSHKKALMSAVKPTVKPAKAKVVFTNEGLRDHWFAVQNLPNSKSLKILCNKPEKLSYSVKPTSDPKCFRVHYNAHDESLKIKVMTAGLKNDVVAENGNFMLAPESNNEPVQDDITGEGSNIDGQENSGNTAETMTVNMASRSPNFIKEPYYA